MIKIKLQFIALYLAQSLVWPFLWLAWKIFLHIKVVGLENLTHLQWPAIFAANHTTELDPLILPARSISPLDPALHMAFVSAERSFYQREERGRLRSKLYGGNIFHLFGAYPAKRGVNNYHLALLKHIQFLNAGCNVAIFPEGKITKTGQFSQAKGGVIHLSLATGAPIIPVSIIGHYGLTPRSFFLRKHTVVVRYGMPIYCEDLVLDKSTLNYSEYRNLANKKVMNAIRELSNIDRNNQNVVFSPRPQLTDNAPNRPQVRLYR